VIHSAGAKKGLLLEDYLKVNAAGTRNLIEEVISSNPGLKKFVFLSSMAAMGPAIEGKASCENDRCSPITYYGISKLKGEEVVLEYLNKIPVTILRPPAVYGPKDEDIYSLFKAVKYGIKPIFGFRTRYINLCYVEDLADAVILSLSSPVSGGKTYIIGDVKDYSWEEIQEEAASVLKIKAFKVRIPAALLFTAGFIAETVSRVTGKTGIISRQKFKEMLEEWRCDITKAKTELGFTPKYTMKEGIKKTVNWYKDNGWL
jgi:nucleoside-diphosphate-sugar epimerase